MNRTYGVSSRSPSGSVLGRGAEVTSEIRALLSELAVLAAQAERDERRVLGEVVERANTGAGRVFD